MTSYTVTAERSGKWWVLQAQEAPGAISQVSRLDQADQIREAIAFVTGEPEDSIEIELHPILSEKLERARANADRLRALADRFSTAAAFESRQFARELAASGLTVRDVGAVLGVSYQRAQQLITSEPAMPTSDYTALIDAHEAMTADDDDESIGGPVHAWVGHRKIFAGHAKELLTSEEIESMQSLAGHWRPL